jgi:hypothetical protein
MDEFDDLVAKICSSATQPQQRAVAEQRLMEILSNPNSWKVFSGLLFQVNDTVCFFICIGLQRMVWRNWRNIPMDDRLLLSQTITHALNTRPTMQRFAKAKLEQVLATVCANSCSIEPVLGMLSEAESPTVNVGLSAMHTVLDLILSDDPKLFPDYRSILHGAVNTILTPLTSLACNSCNYALRTSETSMSLTENAMLTLMSSLDLLKVIVGKIQLGGHVTPEVIDMLFNVINFAANNSSSGASNNNLNVAAVSSIEVLTDIMSKKYLPTSRSVSNQFSVGRPVPGSKESSLVMLLEILLQSIGLLKNFRLVLFTNAVVVVFVFVVFFLLLHICCLFVCWFI